MKIKKIKGYDVLVNGYWLDQKLKALVVGSCKEQHVKFKIYYMNQIKGYNKFKGPSFRVQISEIQMTPQIGTRNVYLRPESIQTHSTKCLLTQLYNQLYFIFLNSTTGRGYIFSFMGNKIKQYLKDLQLPQGAYEIQSVDNLLLFQNYQSQETYVIDILSLKYHHETFINILHRDIESPTTETPAHSVIVYNSIDRSFIPINSEYLINPQTCESKRLFIDALVLTMGHVDEVECVFFLLRRKGCKDHAIQLLYSLIEQQVNLKEMHKLFDTMCQLQRFAIENVDSPTVTQGDKQELIIKEGIYVISQFEFYEHILIPLYQNQKPFYVKQVLITLLHAMTEQDIEPIEEIQHLILKLYLQLNCLTEITDLIMLNVIPANKGIVLFMQEQPQSEDMISLYMDILSLIQDHSTLVHILLHHKYYYEALKFITTRDCQGFSNSLLYKIAQDMQDENFAELVVSISKRNSI